MVFVRIELDADEWGYEFKGGAIPMVGDTIELWYSPPDVAQDAELVEGKVTSRKWQMPLAIDEEIELVLSVAINDPRPDGCVPDCPMWPAVDWTAEHLEQQRRLDKIVASIAERKTDPSTNG
jgi:hypothetical protein